jgi:hypothetical protein
MDQALPIPLGPRRAQAGVSYADPTSDGFWTLDFAVEDARTPAGSISAAWLREHDPSGGFDSGARALLRERPVRIVWLARILLFEVSPVADPAAIASRLGLDVSL